MFWNKMIPTIQKEPDKVVQKPERPADISGYERRTGCKNHHVVRYSMFQGSYPYAGIYSDICFECGEDLKPCVAHIFYTHEWRRDQSYRHSEVWVWNQVETGAVFHRWLKPKKVDK